jgi:putative transposase
MPYNHFNPVLPERKSPSKNSVKTSPLSNRSIILYVTICTTMRAPILANKEAFDCIVGAFSQASYWLVGRFLVMPDHIHFFCAPATFPPYSFHAWLSYEKSVISRTFPLSLREQIGENHLFQMQCWDTQMRTGDGYFQKLEYVRNNPVRKGLVSNPDDWPYQGVVNALSWHD